ncbi:MAG: polysialyltransferase family glycosyltransferase [Bacteroidota bacterium]
MKKIKCLVHIMNPVGVIAGLTAIETIHPRLNVEVSMCVEWPGSEAATFDIFEVVNRLTQQFPYTIRCFIKAKEQNINTLYDEIYFSHDLMENTSPVLFAKYPTAKKICYGDALGAVFKKKEYFSNFSPYRESGNIILKLKIHIARLMDLFKPLLIKNIPYHIDQAVLILPIDQSGRYFNDIPLLVCGKKKTISVVEKCIKSDKQFSRYVEKILIKHNGSKLYLLLTENMSEGGYVDKDKDISMYCEIIEKYCKRGSVILLKPHPGETYDRYSAIVKNMNDKYKIFKISNKYARYPIEIWKKLVNKCTVISIAYPYISLKYLYDIDVIQPMDIKFVKKWVNRWAWNHFINAIDLYSETFKKLDTWDEKSILYTP